LRTHRAAAATAAELLADIEIPDPFSVRDFLKQIADELARPLVLHAVAPDWCGPARWCGAWLETATADHVVFVQDFSTVKTAQTVLHEVGHILLDHPGQDLPSDVGLGAIDRDDIRRARGRTAFSSPEELAAETFSSFVLQRTMFGTQTDWSVDDDPRAALLDARLG
jgi:hypothetical protein